MGVRERFHSVCLSFFLSHDEICSDDYPCAFFLVHKIRPFLRLFSYSGLT